MDSYKRLEAITNDILTRLGVSEVSRGGELLRKAVFLTASGSRRHLSISTLSKSIAEPLGRRPQEIANSMRCAYETAYKKTAFSALSALCQNPAKKPKLSEFIAMTAEMVRFTSETAVLAYDND